MMRRIIPFLVIFPLSFLVQAQVRVKDLFASAPDSIFPLLTQNNRLDCIDFRENNMTARVKNRMDDVSELKELTDDYLLMQVSADSRNNAINQYGMLRVVYRFNILGGKNNLKAEKNTYGEWDGDFGDFGEW